jgi:FixJ family two-component response regulator
MATGDQALVSIVDDDESAREAAAALVGSLGFAVAAFGSAAEFLRSDCRSRTACLIADVRMPGMTGPELYVHLTAAGTPIPTVLVTAFPDEASRARALRAGVRCYLAKPLAPEDLVACIRSAIGDGAGN